MDTLRILNGSSMSKCACVCCSKLLKLRDSAFSQRGGQRFDPAQLHQSTNTQSEYPGQGQGDTQCGSDQALRQPHAAIRSRHPVVTAPEGSALAVSGRGITHPSNGEQIAPSILAHFESLTVVQHEPPFAATLSHDLCNVMDVSNRRPVHANKLRRVQYQCELLDGFAEDQAPSARVNADVIVSGLDPFDLTDREDDLLGAVRNEQAFGVNRRRVCRDPRVLHEAAELILNGQSGTGC